MILIEDINTVIPWELLAKHGSIWGLVIGLFFTIVILIIKSSDKLNKNISKSWRVLLKTILWMAYSYGLLAFLVSWNNKPAPSVFDYTIFLRDSSNGFSDKIKKSLAEVSLIAGNSEPSHLVDTSLQCIHYRGISTSFQNRGNNLASKTSRFTFANNKTSIKVFLTGGDTTINVNFKEEPASLPDNSFTVNAPFNVANIISGIEQNSAFHYKKEGGKNIIRIAYDVSSNTIIENGFLPGKYKFAGGGKVHVLVNGKDCFTSGESLNSSSSSNFQSRDVILQFVNAQAELIVNSSDRQKIINSIIGNIK
jgi:hypothetical protein